MIAEDGDSHDSLETLLYGREWSGLNWGPASRSCASPGARYDQYEDFILC